MGRKKKVKEEVPGVKSWQYGDLAVVCKCGRTQIMKKGIEYGIQLVLTNREDSFVLLKCDECEAEIALRFIEGEKPAEEEVVIEPVIEETVNEGVQEENKQEQSL
jgi:hypothetical protein